MGVVSGKTGTSENQATVLSIQATICSHIYIKSFVNETFSTIDLEDHLGKVELWKKTAPCDSFAYHPYATYTSEEESTRPEEDSDRESHNEGEDEQILKTSKKGLLFVHQSKDQRRLLERYGNEICMLDATYKTTRYSLPLFFVVVKTNIDYQIVGSCIVQSEATDAIFEGLSVLKSWNQKWNVPLLFYGWLFRRRNVSNWIVIPR